MKRIAIIGAGVAGLSCARDLRRAGHSVRVFDKGRSPGGRISTRRHGATAFNHGAPWIEALTPEFRDDLLDAVDAGALRQLRPDLVVIQDGRVIRQLDNRWIFAGWPTMNRYAHHLAADVAVESGLPVTAVVRRAEPEGGFTWEIRRGDGVPSGRFDQVVLALPAPQALQLLPDGTPWDRRLRAVKTTPVLTALLAPEQSWGAPWDAARFLDSDLDRVTRVSAPGPVPPLADAPAPESWVIHASSEYSRRRLEDDPDEVARDLAATLARELGRFLPEVRHLSGHRWRHASTSRPLGQDCLHDADLGLGICGDWCRGSRVEDAWASGRSLAERLLAQVGPAEPPAMQVVWGMDH